MAGTQSGRPRRISALGLGQVDFECREEPRRTEVLRFMRAQHAVLSTCLPVFDHVFDQVQGHVSNEPFEAFEAGSWAWDSNELLMFERYGLALDPEFVAYAVQHARA